MGPVARALIQILTRKYPQETAYRSPPAPSLPPFTFSCLSFQIALPHDIYVRVLSNFDKYDSIESGGKANVIVVDRRLRGCPPQFVLSYFRGRRRCFKEV